MIKWLKGLFKRKQTVFVSKPVTFVLPKGTKLPKPLEYYSLGSGHYGGGGKYKEEFYVVKRGETLVIKED